MSSSKVVETNLDEGVLHNQNHVDSAAYSRIGSYAPDNSEWVHRWAVGNTAFHRDQPNAFLDANEDLMFEEKSKSLFLPLCGKTPDILWMYNKGHTVCGVEIAEQPVRELFEENNIDKDVEQIENIGTLYKSKDGRLKLYVADLFDLSQSECGQFDIIWDSKSLVAINIDDHPMYRDLMLSLLKPDGVYYLAVLEYDPTVWPGPPHSLSDKLIKDLYDGRCDIKLVEESERAGQNINAVKSVSNDVDQPQPKLSSAGAAIKTSSYILDRWYKMVLKQ